MLIEWTGELHLLMKDAETQLWSPHRVLVAHPGWRGSAATVQFDSDGGRIATSVIMRVEDSAWKVWDVATGV